MLGVISHGRSGATGNIWRELRTKLLGLYPDADFATAGHTHHLLHQVDHALSMDKDGEDHWRETHSDSDRELYVCRSGSKYSMEALYTPLPIGSPIIYFEKDGTFTVDVETLQYRRI